MVIKLFLFFLAGTMLLSCAHVDEKGIKESHDNLVLYAHVTVGFPSEDMAMEEYTDTIVLYSLVGNVTPFALVGMSGDSEHTFSKKDIMFSKRLKDRVTKIYFGDNLRQYLAYSHDQYGLLYLARTDWEKDEFILLSHYKYSDTLWKPILAKCLQIHENRKTPKVQESF